MKTEPYDAHVNTWVKHHARQLSYKAIANGYQPQALHKYTDQNGIATHYRIRLKHPTTMEKWIRPMRHNGAGFVLGEPEYPNGKPLYRLHNMVTNTDDPIFLVEGELCADALVEIGMQSTTSGAADSVGRTDWTPLAGRTVTIWPDNDEAGKRYAQEAIERLQVMDCKVNIIDVARLDLPLKGDVVDWLAAHPSATEEDIFALPIMATGECELPPHASDAEPQSTNDEALLRSLAIMSPIEYDRARKNAAERMGIRPATLDKQVAALSKAEVDTGIDFDDIAPWPEPIKPAQLLTDIAAIVNRYIVCQEETAHAVALWAAMTWFIDVVQVAPLAVITAPEKRCGKSQLLFLLGRLVCRPLTASNISPAALFRSIDAWRPTLLVDEADTFMRENEELRGLLNCGHTRDSAYIVRVVGEDYTPKKFSVWGAKALTGIGHLPDTLMDRAITLELRRKLPHEQVDRLRYTEPELFNALASKLARFAEDYREAVQLRRPMLPASLNDRAQDNWEPLLAIADVAGDKWPEWGRAAALKLSDSTSPTESVGTELLADIHTIFEAKSVNRITTVDLLEALCEDEEAPWATYNRGKPMSPRQLARRLDGYGIKSKNLKIGYGAVRKGFERDQFEEAFKRYLSSATPENIRYPLLSNSGATSSVADENQVAATASVSATSKALPYIDGSGVAGETWGTEGIVEVEI